MKGKNPDFICVGFQKSGTTTLYEILKQHFGIILCRDVKEPMYYRVKGLRVIGGKRYYQWRYFGHIKPEETRLIGEVNAGLTFTGCAKKICKDFSGETKLIFMMRNPVDRSYSAYKYFLARGFLPIKTVKEDQRYGHAVAFDHYVHEILDHRKYRQNIMKKRLKYLVFSQSNYGTCIEEFEQTFPNRKLIFFEEFIQNQEKACEDLFQFLEIEKDHGIDYTVRANEGNECAVSGWRAKQLIAFKGIRYLLKEFCDMMKWAPGLYKRYEHYYEKIRKKCLVYDEDRCQMLPETRSYLNSYFAKEIKMVERLSGRDLNEIWHYKESI